MKRSQCTENARIWLFKPKIERVSPTFPVHQSSKQVAQRLFCSDFSPQNSRSCLSTDDFLTLNTPRLWHVNESSTRMVRDNNVPFQKMILRELLCLYQQPSSGKLMAAVEKSNNGVLTQDTAPNPTEVLLTKEISWSKNLETLFNDQGGRYLASQLLCSKMWNKGKMWYFCKTKQLFLSWLRQLFC